MNTKNYFCDTWALSSIKTTETEYKVREFVNQFKKFENLLQALELPVLDIYLFSGDYGVSIDIEFNRDDWGMFRMNLEVINAYLKTYLPMNSYEDVISDISDEIKTYHLQYDLDLGGYQFEYPSHDYFHMSLCG